MIYAIRFLILFYAVLSNINAKEIVVEAYGKNFDEALSNAKVIAIDIANGSYMNYEQYIKDNQLYTEKITQIRNGKIINFDVLSFVDNKITVNFEVEKRERSKTLEDKSYQLDSIKDYLTDMLDWIKENQKKISALNEQAKPLVGKIKNIKVVPGIKQTEVTFFADVNWNKEWLVNSREILTVISSKEKKYRNLDKQLLLSITQEMQKIDPILAGLFSIAIPNMEENNKKMVCYKDGNFTGDIDCYYGNELLKHLPYFSDIPLKVVGYDQEKNKVFENDLNVSQHNLFLHVQKNDKMKTFPLQKRFYSPAIAIFPNNSQDLNFQMKLSNELLLNIDHFDIEFTS